MANALRFVEGKQTTRLTPEHIVENPLSSYLSVFFLFHSSCCSLLLHAVSNNNSNKNRMNYTPSEYKQVWLLPIVLFNPSVLILFFPLSAWSLNKAENKILRLNYLWRHFKYYYHSPFIWIYHIIFKKL